MSEPQEFEAVVSPTGDVVIPSDSVRRLALAPGQHVQVVVSAPRRRRNMRGVLSGRLPDISPEEIARVRRNVWGELASGE